MMDSLADFEDADTSCLSAAIGMGSGVLISFAVWLAVVDVWLLLR